MIKNIFIKMINCYKYFISPLLGNHCRFHESCSQYAVRMLRERSLPDALLQIIIRVLKCQPFYNNNCEEKVR